MVPDGIAGIDQKAGGVHCSVGRSHKSVATQISHLAPSINP